MMINNFKQLLAEAKKVSTKRQRPVRVVIAAGNDEAALSALVKAKKMGIADGLLLGDRNLINQTLKEVDNKHLTQFNIIEEYEERAICNRAIQAIHKGEAEIVLKGKVKSSSILKAAFDHF